MMFGYEPPIKIFQKEMEMELEGEVLRAVRKVAVHIDKDELLKALEYDRGQYENGYRDGQRNVPRWIPCSERLPENKDGWTELIMSMKNGKVMFGFWTDTEGFCRPFLDGVCRVDEVVAWMPLPDPYREGDV